MIETLLAACLAASLAGTTPAHAYAGEIGTDAYILMIDGEVIDSYGDLDAPYRLHSVRKSLLGLLYGIAEARGEADLDATLGELGISDYSPLSRTEASARVIDLLASRSGVHRSAVHENAGFDAVRPPPGSHGPGEHWFYSNWDFNAAGTAYQIQNGRSICRDLNDRIAEPLGLADFTTADCAWRYSPRSRHPAYVFRMSARDLARIGELMANGGRWNGEQLVPASWIERSIAPRSQVTRPDGIEMPGVAYGLMWWTRWPGTPFYETVDLGEGAFAASGTGTQLLLVAPERGLVFVHRNDTDVPSSEYRSIDDDQIARLLALALEAPRRGLR